MHELGIAIWLLERAKEIADRHGAGEVIAVEVRVGELSGVDPDALQFAFEAAREGVPVCGRARLKVEWVPLKVQCPACGYQGSPAPFSLACGGCGSTRTAVAAGEELEMVAVEIEPQAGTELSREYRGRKGVS